MSDVMRALPFKKLINWIWHEYQDNKTIFGIPESKFFQSSNSNTFEIFGSKLNLPIGPAAGPHTQLAQNIVGAYLCGSRYFELKTVQVLDSLEIAKPCIWAEDECYNTEWSTELSIQGAFEEYVKAWFILHVLKKEVMGQDNGSFIFNMSVGYDLKGIKTKKVDDFIEGLKDASQTGIFQECRDVLIQQVKSFKNVDEEYINGVSSNICNSITLSTMHGCPPQEIEAICKYLLSEKKLHTFVKMNPTLLGYDFVKNTLDQMGYGYIQLREESFSHDLQYGDGVEMLGRLKQFAQDHQKEFGIKLSNTLPVKITGNELPGEEMYMSGRSLYPLTINLASKLAGELNGDINISFSGGADYHNLPAILETGIRPVTFATTLLKPGGYMRIRQMAEEIDNKAADFAGQKIDLKKLKQLAKSAFSDVNHLKEKRQVVSRKINRPLPLTDCFIAPCQTGCPIGQDIPEYIRLVGAGKYPEAYQLIISKNPLPFITGEICDHKCMFKCTRLDYDDPVCIRGLKKVAAEKGSDKYAVSSIKEMSQETAKVAVIGAGPSGLAAGYFLSRAGMDVTIFDKRTTPGGTVAHVIPEFRISPEAISKDIEMIKSTGVKFRLGVENVSINQLKSDGYKYVYLAIGAGKSKAVEFIADSKNVMGAIEFLTEFKKDQTKLQLGKNVAVVGGGNSAMDTARAAKRLAGVDRVYIVYRRTKEDMPAAKEEVKLALKEGVILKELLSPVSLVNGVLKCQKMTLGEPDASGRRRPLPLENEFEEIAVDAVIFAIGEQVDLDWLAMNGVAVDKRGKIHVNPETLETNLEKVYIGGDVLLGPSTVVEAISQGRRAADAILAKEKMLPENKDASVSAVKSPMVQIMEKKGRLIPSFGAVEKEANRCLECDLVCNICTEVCPNRANIAIEVPGGKYQILHMDGMCNECGNCAAFCSYQGRPYQDKLTLYWEKEDFMSSKNPGFLLTENNSEPTFQIRNEGNVSTVKFNSEGQPSIPVDQEVAQIIWTVFRKYSYLF